MAVLPRQINAMLVELAPQHYEASADNLERLTIHPTSNQNGAHCDSSRRRSTSNAAHRNSFNTSFDGMK